MRAYVTIVDGDFDLLPFFVRHYRRLGATEFPLLVYGTGDDMEIALAMVRGEGACPMQLGLLPPETFSARNREAQIARVHPDGEWAFFCDLDEFAELDADAVDQLVCDCHPYVAGHWVDRIAVDGALVAAHEREPLERQYPMAGALRRTWKMGDLVYVLSPRAPSLHHPNACRWGKRLLQHADQGVRVHHFKWQANVTGRLRRRLERIDAVGKSRTPWAGRVRAMLAHLEEHNGIDPGLLTYAGDVLGI